MRQIHRVQGLKGWGLDARDGEIGSFQQIYFDDQEWRVRYLVVHTGTWLFGRSVLIAPRAVAAIDTDGERISVDLPRDEVEGSPPLDFEEPLSRHYEEAYHRFYGWAPYWLGPGFGGVPPAIPPMMGVEEPVRQLPCPHLRGSDEVTGYGVSTKNGRLGHVEDILIDDESWTLRYIEVDTRRWWPGKRVLIAPTWIEAIGWPEREISLTLNRDTLREAPEYDPSVTITPEYEVRLFQHYARAAEEN
jgi:uncharacterized protein YrrD